MKKTEKIIETKIFVQTSRGHIEIYSNGKWVNPSTEEIIDEFGLQPFHCGTILDGAGLFKAFNTYNWSAPITICGSANEELDFAIVNLHLGGDARGNYGGPFYVDNYEDLQFLLSQYSFLAIETEESSYYIECGNGEAYFEFDTFDIDDLKEGTELGSDQLDELEHYKL